MHIPENYLSPSTCAVMTAAMVPVWGYSINKVRTEIPKARMPLLGIGAAFSFLGMMFNVPLPGGTTGHAVGGTLIAILTGSPAAGCISVSIALLIQALLFGDGVDDGKKIFHELRSSPVAGSMVVRMSRNPREHIPSRNIKMDYHCKKVTIYRPQRRKEKHLREKLELTAIYVHESGKKGTEWFLLTTVTVKSEKEIEKLVQCYAHRWKIERFHFILKSGCKIEKNQAREYGSFQGCIR